MAALIKKQIDIFPISGYEPDSYIFVKGIRIVNIKKIDSKDVLYETDTATRLIKKYLDTVLDKQSLLLITDYIKDLTSTGILDYSYLTDLSKQARFISNELKCICTVSQLIQLYSK